MKKEFEREANVGVECFPEDSTAVEDSPRLRIVVIDPAQEWSDGGGTLRESIGEWTKLRGRSPRLYPASLVWCARKPGRELREKVENWLAWQRVQVEITSGALAGDFDRSEIDEIRTKSRDAEGDARDEVWAAYRYVALHDAKEADSVRVIDLGAGHSSAGKSLCGRVLAAMTSQALLNESPGAGYIERRWPQAFKDSGAWPLKSLRQAFLDGSLDRLIDPDLYLRQRIPQFVARGDFGLASGGDPASGYSRVWFKEPISPDEVAFDPDVYLLTAAKAKALKERGQIPTEVGNGTGTGGGSTQPEAKGAEESPSVTVTPTAGKQKLRLSGAIPSEVWNRLGTKLIPKLKSSVNLRLGLDFTFELEDRDAQQVLNDLKQTLADLGLDQVIRIEKA